VPSGTCTVPWWPRATCPVPVGGAGTRFGELVAACYEQEFKIGEKLSYWYAAVC
jgi:hypothetical protein